jgi:hypothetical protein
LALVLNRGSCRAWDPDSDLVAVTATSVDHARMQPADVVDVDLW